MRILLLSLAPLLALSACQRPPETGQPADVRTTAPVQPADSAPLDDSRPHIGGLLRVDDLAGLPAGLELHLRLLDITDPSQTPVLVTERRLPAPTQLPYRYGLNYDPAQIDAEHRYAIEASLIVGGAATLYGTPAPMPVLTQGAGDSAPLSLVRGGVSAASIDPAEQAKLGFQQLESTIGGLRRTTGERIDEQVTVGWDAFSDPSGVRMARETVDFGEAGTAAFRYAYREGRPWVLVREQGGVTTWLGWDDQGMVVLNQRGEDGEAVDEAEAQRLYRRAEEVARQVRRR